MSLAERRGLIREGYWSHSFEQRRQGVMGHKFRPMTEKDEVTKCLGT